MRSIEVEQLITDLREEKPQSAVIVHDKDSSTVVIVEETEERLVFNVEESRLLFSNRETVKRLFEALDYPEEVFVELHGLEIEPETMAELESLASTVDEM